MTEGDHARDSLTLERTDAAAASHPRERAADAEDLVGRALLHFRIVGRLGEGGMGVVYRAIDERLRRPVALKVLASRYLLDDRNKEMIFREARSAAALTHANIAAIHEVHDGEDGAFYVMELVEGETLRERIARAGRVPVEETLRWGAQIARALARAHEAGVVHRDLKADNVMITKGGDVKLLDFGLAKVIDAAEPVLVESGSGTSTGAAALAPTIAASAKSTEHGRVMGTPAYMAPEQARGEAVDARADVFAFGVVLYEMLTGKAPFAHRSGMPWTWGDGASGDWKMGARVRELAPNAPREVEELVRRCVAFEAEARFADGAALATAVDACARGIERSKRARLGAIVAGAMGLALVTWAVASGVRGRAAPLAAPSASAPAAPWRAPGACFARGLAAFKRESIDAAIAQWDEALARDPRCGGAAVRAMWASSVAGNEDFRQRFASASKLADTLSPEERALLDAAIPFAAAQPDLAETLHRLEALTARWPDWDEGWYLLGWRRSGAHDRDGARAAYQRAIALDPAFATALLSLAPYLPAGDREAELRRCVAIAPLDSACRASLLTQLFSARDCPATERAARDWIAEMPESAGGYGYLAGALRATGAPREAVEEAWRREQSLTRKLRPAGKPDDQGDLEDDAAHAFLFADFTAAEEPLSRTESGALDRGEFFPRIHAAWLRVRLLDETGRSAEAARVAVDIVRRFRALTQPPELLDFASLALVRRARETGLLDAKEAQASVEALGRGDYLGARTKWLGLDALLATTAEEARLSIGRRVEPAAGADESAFWLYVEGRTFLLAGDAAHARTLLESASSQCRLVWDPEMFDLVDVLRLQGRACESLGDAGCARDAYGSILRRWSDPKPRSTTVEDARRRLAKLE